MYGDNALPSHNVQERLLIAVPLYKLVPSFWKGGGEENNAKCFLEGYIMNSVLLMGYDPIIDIHVFLNLYSFASDLS